MVRRLVPVVACGMLGCGTRDDASYDPPVLIVDQAPITEDIGIDVEPGVGAGLFVETGSDGSWSVTTSCDTELTDFECDWDVVLSVEAGMRIRRIRAVDFELWDDVTSIDDGALYLRVLTGTDLDGVTFSAPPGAALTVDALLDGRSDPRYLFWNARGAVQSGAPSNPVQLLPEAE